MIVDVETPTAVDIPIAVGAGAPPVAVRGSIYALVLITLVYGISIVDRSIFGLLLPSIKREFTLSDTELGLIGSLGFALTYALAGLPLARLSDRVSRKRIIVASLACYSVVTALTGAVGSAFQLALARVGLAIGEAAALPAGTAMISDYFPRRTRSRAMAVLGAGPPLATLAGFVIAGSVSQAYGWRWGFSSIGLLGLALALLTAFTVREPRRGAAEDAAADVEPLDLRVALRFLAGQRSYVLLVAAGVLMACTMASISQWGPAFLVRLYHFTPRALGGYVGMINGVGGLVGTLLGGMLSDAIGRRAFKWKLLVPAAACGLAAPAILLFLFGAGSGWAMAGLTATIALVAMQYGALFATLQSVVKLRVRAFSVSVFLACTTIVGVGLGPVIVGAVSDALTPAYGAAALRFAMIVPAATCLAAGVLIALAIRFVHADLARTQTAAHAEAI